MDKHKLLPRGPGQGISARVNDKWDTTLCHVELVLRYTHEENEKIKTQLRSIVDKHGKAMRAEIEEAFDVTIRDISTKGY